MFFLREKVCRGKLSFLHTLFLENEAQIDKKQLWNNAFYVNTSQSAKS